MNKSVGYLFSYLLMIVLLCSAVVYAESATHTFKTLITDTIDKTPQNRNYTSINDMWPALLSDSDTIQITSPLRAFSENSQLAKNLYRVGSDQTPGFADTHVSDPVNSNWMNYIEKQSFWIGTSPNAVKYDSDPGNRDVVVNTYSAMAYSAKLSGNDWGISICTSDLSPTDTTNWASCYFDSNARTDRHRIPIKFMGSYWIISQMEQPSAPLASSTTVINGGQVKLAKETSYGNISVGQTLDGGTFIIRLSDVSVAVGPYNEHPAIIDVLDANNVVIGQVEVYAGTTVTFVQSGTGNSIKVHVYNTHPGFTLNEKWAEMAIYTDEITLKDGMRYNLVPVTDTDKDYKVSLLWKNRDYSSAADSNVADSLREIVVYNVDSFGSKTIAGDVKNFLMSTQAFKLTYQGLDLTDDDYQSMEYDALSSDTYRVATVSGDTSCGSSSTDDFSYTAKLVKIKTGGDQLLGGTGDGLSGDYLFDKVLFDPIGNAYNNTNQSQNWAFVSSTFSAGTSGTQNYGAASKMPVVFYIVPGRECWNWDVLEYSANAQVAKGIKFDTAGNNSVVQGRIFFNNATMGSESNGSILMVEDAGYWGIGSNNQVIVAVPFFVVDASTIRFRSTDSSTRAVYYQGLGSTSFPLKEPTFVTERGSKVTNVGTTDANIKVAKRVGMPTFQLSFEYNLTCADGTLYGSCSSSKPEMCIDGMLVDNATYCGCPAGHVVSGNTCTWGSTQNINISSCGELNETNTIYKLTQDISAQGTCFNITAPYIELDGNGYTVTGDLMGAGIYSSNSEINNAVIKNIKLNYFKNGIYLENNGWPNLGKYSDILIDNVSIVSSYDSIRTAQSVTGPMNNITIRNSNLYSSQFFALEIDNLDAGTLENLTITKGNVQLCGLSNTQIKNNWMNSTLNGGCGNLNNNNVVSNNTIYQGVGFYGNANVINDNLIIMDGLRTLGSNNHVYKNRIDSLTIFEGTNNNVYNNEIHGSVMVESDAFYNNITNNTIIGQTGIRTNYLTSANNKFIRNNITASTWIENTGYSNVFNDSMTGNIYYFTNGTPSWCVYNISDSNADGWADGGTSLPFNSSIAQWIGGGADWHPYVGTCLNHAITNLTLSPTPAEINSTLLCRFNISGPAANYNISVNWTKNDVPLYPTIVNNVPNIDFFIFVRQLNSSNTQINDRWKCSVAAFHNNAWSNTAISNEVTIVLGPPPACADGTAQGSCSSTKPKWCTDENLLVDNATKCGCPVNYVINDTICSPVSNPPLPNGSNSSGYGITLNEGWNIFSLPFTPSNNSTASVFGTTQGNITAIWSYENGQWLNYAPGEGGTLTTLTEGKAYLADVAYPTILEGIQNGNAVEMRGGISTNGTQRVTISNPMPAMPIPPFEIGVHNGWNLLGIYANSNLQINDIIGSCIGGDYYVLNSGTYAPAYGSTNIPLLGGFWLYKNADCTYYPRT